MEIGSNYSTFKSFIKYGSNNDIKIFKIQGGFFLAPPNFTKSQAHYKFMNLENFRGGGAVQIIQSLGISQI